MCENTKVGMIVRVTDLPESLSIFEISLSCKTPKYAYDRSEDSSEENILTKKFYHLWSDTNLKLNFT